MSTLSTTSTASAQPGYMTLAASGELSRRAEALWAMLADCNICPRDCRVNRLKGEIAACFAAELPVVSSHVAHFGEEPCLTGTHGAGNIFFGLCNMRCVYCQNFQISQNYKGERKNEVSFERFAEMMIELQDRGCHSINFVSPTHFVPQMVKGIELAHARGLRIPIVYNTNGYDSVEVLRLLDGIVDVYLPDLKYASDEAGQQYSLVFGYAAAARDAIKEMWRQVGPLELDERGIARRGMILRHLVLPNDLAESEECLKWIRDHLGTDVTLSVMAQYYPTNKAERHVLLNRKITLREYERVVAKAERMGFKNILTQEHHQASEFYRPDFSQEHPFHWGNTEQEMEDGGKKMLNAEC
ncbi:radical SAM protein [Candidatus Sumerlaeota bacterium]|nr:radical SAM protein [Candidatus Sumerlaeota bacterium]MBI3734907.1 radical SAM protein [Candidatus Sumerlaeota bacterium]